MHGLPCNKASGKAGCRSCLPDNSRGVTVGLQQKRATFLSPHVGKIQFISIGQLGNLRQIEGCQPDTYTDQDGLQRSSRDRVSGLLNQNSPKIHKVLEALYGS